ncbi:MAG TPA: prepilin-type N-terminal cleavage/methylation domain-containing protein [Pyrinomonadaceae bacterium]|nr:prepilin-type N-terminal cleavage/methylation domain-containing protein [Pyrinomonadaceae bacterium]
MARATHGGEAGFSLMELMVSMAVTLVLLSTAAALLSDSFDIRARENRKSDSLYDVQRALNVMSREIGNTGYGLTNNGVHPADSGGAAAANASRIRVRANLDGSADGTVQANEDVTFVYQAANNAVVRYDRATDEADVLADGLPPLANGASPIQFAYLRRDNAGNLVAANPATAEVVRLTVVAMQEPVNSTPATPVRLVSHITLRNAILTR